MTRCHTARVRSHAERGFSLVEMLVAMLLGIILMAAVVQIFIGSKQTYRMREQVAALTDNGRFAIELMQREIRMAGYSGCRTLSSLQPNVVADSPPDFSEVADGIQGFNNGSGWVNPTSTTRVAGTDVLTVTHASGGGVPLTSNMADRAAPLNVSSQTSVMYDSQLLLVSDCQKVDMFRASTVTENSGTYTINHTNAANTSDLLSRAYEENAMVMTMGSTTFFVGVNAGGEGSLYMVPLGSATADELVTGVQDMQILYAVDTDGDRQPDDYVEAQAVTDWATVLGVNVGFLLHTDNNVAADPQALAFNGASANPSSDKRLRTSFWSAVALRNRMN